jgi:phosphate transport system substrate-binding protein
MRYVIPALVLAFSLTSPDAAAQAVRVAGTGAAVGAIELLLTEYRRAHPVARFGAVEAIGSGGALRAARAGALDIALVARPLGEADVAAGLRALEYARTPFVVAVSAKSPVTSLTRSQLAAAYAGSLEAWPDGTRVRPVLRPADDIDTRHLKNFGPEVGRAVDQALMRPGMLVASTDREAADILERTPGTLGPSTLGLILSEKRGLRALELDGVAPTLQALESGAYPHYKSLHLVTGPKGAGTDGEGFIRFVTSPAGKALLQRTGHLVPPFRGK